MTSKCRWGCWKRAGAAAALFAFLALAASAQQPAETPAPAAPPNPAQPSKQEKAQAGATTQQPPPKQQDPNPPTTPPAGTPPAGTSNDRLFWTLPNFLTLEKAKGVPPLTAKEKFKVVARSTFDPVEYPYVGFLAGISQAENSEPGYGQGAAGYGKRYGAAFADNTIENFMTGAVLPSLLHQDPRYYQLGTGGFRHRMVYAVSRNFITRGDSGKRQFNFSEIAGAAMAAGIATSYHPAGDRNVANTVSVWWTQIGWDTVAIVVKEFWPDIRRKAHKRKE